MTDHDELASAYLDGEVTPVERATVEGDSTLMARVEELRSVRALLRDSSAPAGPAISATAVAQAADERDAAIAAALAAAMPSSHQPAHETAPERGHGQTRRTRPRPLRAGSGRRRALLALAGVAAAAVIAVAVVAASRSTSTITASPGSSATIAAAPTLAPAARPATAAGQPDTTAAPAPSPATTAAAAASPIAPSGAAAKSPPVIDLGALTNAAAVRAAVATAPPATTELDPCSLAPARLVGRAQWNGIGVYVYVLDGQAVVVATTGCERLVEVPLS
jgi:DNA segregation ATPase FtsK/SpoIIIE, S-DNA-T family